MDKTNPTATANLPHELPVGSTHKATYCGYEVSIFGSAQVLRTTSGIRGLAEVTIRVIDAHRVEIIGGL